jgi:DNA-binding MarR family transcriptional regulator
MNDAVRKPHEGASEEPDDPWLKREAELGSLATCIPFLLRLTADDVFREFRRRVGDPDIAPGRFPALALIDHDPGINQTELARRLGRDKSSITPIIDDLEERNLVRRERLTQDRRHYGLSLTQQGQVMLRQLSRYVDEQEKAFEEVVGSADFALFTRVLRRIATSIS